MAGWNHTGKFKEKPCAVCGLVFKPRSGVHKFCSPECKGKHQYTSGRVTTKSQYETISGNWKRYCSRLLYAAGKKRSELSVEDILDLLEKQKYKCALSGLDLTCQLEKGKKFPHNVSIDRIKAGGPYTKDNIQLVCRAVNHWRADTDLTDFIEICRAVVNHQDNEIGG